MCLCLCGRDPQDPEVQGEFQKVIALALRYGFQLNGCLREAAGAFDDLLCDLKPNAVRELERARQAVQQQMDADRLETQLTTHPDATSQRLN